MEYKTQKNVIQYCPYCGTKLDNGARFCKNCGEEIIQRKNENAESHQDTTENRSTRRTVYEGSLHKCPNCGEVLKSFVSNCPSCGHEIRGTRATNSAKEFASKLEEIESQKMAFVEEKKSVMKMVFGKDFKDEDEIGKAQREFDSQKEQEKATLIINYPIPNTKEDILEFMILVASNINTKKDLGNEVAKAWISKLEQVYTRAKLSMSNSSDFLQIKDIYESKKKDIKIKKLKKVMGSVSFVVGYLFLIGLLWDPAITITISIVIVIIIGLIIFLFKRNSSKRR